jgi:hypothetical protein
MPSPGKKGDNGWRRYAGLTVQFLSAIGISLFLGFSADKWLRWKFPLFVWLLPLLVITGMIVSIIRDQSK